MRITSKTLYKDFAPLEPYISEEEKKRLQDAVVSDKFGKNGMWDMKIGDFVKCCNGDVSPLVEDVNKSERVADIYVLRAFSSFVEEFIKVVENVTPKPTSDEIRAQKTCLKVSVAEGILLFVREYFGLHSFGEAESLPLSDYLIAKKDNYNKVMAQREYAKIQNEKIKSK